MDFVSLSTTRLRTASFVRSMLSFMLLFIGATSPNLAVKAACDRAPDKVQLPKLLKGVEEVPGLAANLSGLFTSLYSVPAQRSVVGAAVIRAAVATLDDLQ